MARRSTNAGRTNDPEGLRNRILDAAMTCFQRDGYCGTNMRDVMSAAGTTSGALHHHFPTKKDLGQAVLDERVRSAVEHTWVSAVRAARTAVDGVLMVFADVAAELDGKQRVEGCPVNNLAIELALMDDDLRLSLNATFAIWRQAIAAKAEEDLKSGVPMLMGANDWALLAVAQFSGAMAMAKASQSTHPLRESARLLKKLARAPNLGRRSGA